MVIEIWTLGKNNDPFIEEGVQIYLQKLKPWCTVTMHILSLPKKLSTDKPEQLMAAEEALVLKRLNPTDCLILLDEHGKMLNSEAWSSQFQNLMNRSVKKVVLLIGGAYGVSDRIKELAHEKWSLSRLVFPHQLVRLIVAEQVYRSFSILNHTPYHHS